MPSNQDRSTKAEHLRVVQFEPIPYVNLTDQVYRAIKDRILANELEVGSRLRDEELAQQLSVSRTPVREALIRLNRERLVEIIPRSGTRVRTFTERDIEEIFDLRIALEALAVRKAAVRIEAAQLTRLREMFERAETMLKCGDAKAALDFDTEMHETILQASGNERLQEMMTTINDCVTLFRNIGAGTPFHRGFNYRHREILRALERRHPDMAARALAEHIEVAKTELFRDFKQRQLLDATVKAPGRAKRAARRAKPLIESRTLGPGRPRQ